MQRIIPTILKVSDEDWEAYEKMQKSSELNAAVRDCLNIAVLPTLPDIGNLAKDAANWDVKWLLVEGSPEHGVISLAANHFYLKGQLRMQLQADGNHSAIATLVVDLTPEKGNRHEGKERSAPLTARAELLTDSVPVDAFVNAFKGGLGDVLSLADALVEVGSGWLQSMAAPKSYATLTVTYHEPPWKGTVTYERNLAYDYDEFVPTASQLHAISEKYKLEMTLGDPIQTTENSQILKASTQTKGSFEARQKVRARECSWDMEGNAVIDDRDFSEISLTEIDPAKGIYRLEIKPPKDKVIPLVIVYKGKCRGVLFPSGTYDQPLKYPLPERCLR